jgi:hypothetical protein
MVNVVMATPSASALVPAWLSGGTSTA